MSNEPPDEGPQALADDAAVLAASSTGITEETLSRARAQYVKRDRCYALLQAAATIYAAIGIYDKDILKAASADAEALLAEIEKREGAAMTLRPKEPDCYDYVRRYYGVPAYIGVRVIAGGKPGVIVAAKSDLHYVHIRLDGAKHSNPYHPTYGIEYLTGAKS